MTQSKTIEIILIILIICLLYPVSAWKIVGAWKEVEDNKLNVERSRVLNEVCGSRGGSYQLGNINCR